MSARVRNLSGQVRHHGIDLLLFPTDSHRVLAWAGRPTHVRFGSKADMCGAKEHVHLTPNSDRKSGLSQKVVSALRTSGNWMLDGCQNYHLPVVFPFVQLRPAQIYVRLFDRDRTQGVQDARESASAKGQVLGLRCPDGV